MRWYKLEEKRPRLYSVILACYKYKIDDKIDGKIDLGIDRRYFGVFSVDIPLRLSGLPLSEIRENNHLFEYVFLKDMVYNKFRNYLIISPKDIIVWAPLPHLFSFDEDNKKEQFNIGENLDI